MNPAQSEEYSLLLTIFRRGLWNSLVSKGDVVKWADGIILAENEPDYFFIELSLASDIYQLLNIIGTLSILNGPIVGRILLGFLHFKIENRLIAPLKMVFILDEINANDALSGEERVRLYQLSDEFHNKYGMKIFKEWETEALEFLFDYREFRIDNIVEWDIINSAFENGLKNM